MQIKSTRLVSVNLPANLPAVPTDIQNIETFVRPPLSGTVEARPHTAVYKMHKYFARRPWNVFSQLVSHYSAPGDITLDPFCGGGTTVIESLKLRRKAIGVDVNPLATYVTEMECRPIDLELLEKAFSQVGNTAKQKILPLYSTSCRHCGSKVIADWIEWDEKNCQMVRVKYRCLRCGVTQKTPDRMDINLSKQIATSLATRFRNSNLWFPKTKIPRGDKTDSLLKHNIAYFHELFTKRNLLALSILLKAIEGLADGDAKEFLKFAFSGSLKWASRQSHLRGRIVEGWAIHAYWIYHRSLEMNVWNIFERRALAVLRGKKYSSRHIGTSCKLATDFNDLANGNANCMILNESSTSLPVPDESIDCIITDPPYGSNINYAELSDFWYVWVSKGKTTEKTQEVIINKTQGKTLANYEALLHAVFKECYRVLKPHSFLVCTFNSKDMRVVASFIVAASRAGFLLYQNPIRAYTTTLHAMQIGAFVGDFIFTFVKEKTPQQKSIQAVGKLRDLEGSLSDLIAETAKGGLTEPQLRERAYRILIPFLGKYARTDISTCREAVSFFEGKMREHETYFRSTRERITTTRRQRFRKQLRD
jgi:DNA modification methylase/DNA-directed RNA polymerase subunit RPC12/RpoP